MSRRLLLPTSEACAVVICWVLGDGHSLGIGDGWPDTLKTSLVVLGWVLALDAVRTFTRKPSFIPKLLLILAGLIAAVAICVGLYAAYDAASLKVIISVTAVLGLWLMLLIIRELRRFRY